MRVALTAPLMIAAVPRALNMIVAVEHDPGDTSTRKTGFLSVARISVATRRAVRKRSEVAEVLFAHADVAGLHTVFVPETKSLDSLVYTLEGCSLGLVATVPRSGVAIVTISICFACLGAIPANAKHAVVGRRVLVVVTVRRREASLEIEYTIV